LSSHENEISARRLTEAQAQAFQKRWAILDAAEREELVSTSMTLKFRQLAVLMASAQKLGWTEELAAEEDEVRKRWARLRQVLRA
jgi:hypothetical protein